MYKMDKYKLGIFILVALLIGLGIISFVSADLGTFTQGKDVILKGNLNATFVTVSVYFPNSSIAVNNQTMDQKKGNIWEYTFTNTSTQGIYIYDYCDENADNCKENIFELTTTGRSLTTDKSIIYVVFFFLFIFLFIITILGINKLPSSNEKDEWGRIMSISYLKYFRSVLWLFLWMLLIGIMFMASNLGFAYLGETLFANMFFNIYRIMFAISPIMIIVWGVWFFVKFFHDKQFQSMINRGIFPQRL